MDSENWKVASYQIFPGTDGTCELYISQWRSYTEQEVADSDRKDKDNLAKWRTVRSSHDSLDSAFEKIKTYT